MNKIIKAAISILVAICLTGCSAFRPSKQGITISTPVSGADVFINGIYAGQAPLTTQVQRDTDVSIMVRRNGYQPGIRMIGYHFNATGVLDIIGTCLFLLPCIGLFCSGAWSLDETNVIVPMYPAE